MESPLVTVVVVDEVVVKLSAHRSLPIPQNSVLTFSYREQRVVPAKTQGPLVPAIHAKQESAPV